MTPAVRELPPLLRLPLLLLGMAALVIGSLAGLARLGVDVPALARAQAGGHGALMVAAFFGTVISLERAVALRRLWPYFGPSFAGLGGLAVWLLRYDIARQTIRQTGLTRFVAICLLSGYAWLAVGGLLGLAGGFGTGHAWRDAALHAVFLGFVFAMVIGHAPIIFPAVMRVKISYHPVFYLPLVALHLSVLARVAGGLGEIWPLRRGAAIANGVALLLFVLTLLSRVLSGAMKREATR